MKRSKAIIAGAVGVAALWSAGWFAGRSLYVEPEADMAIENLRQGDFFFTFDKREIGGFPFGYDVAYSNVSISDSSRSWTWTMPGLRLSADLAGGDRITLTPSPESHFETTALSAGEGAPGLGMDIASEALRVVVSPEGGDTAVELRADAFKATQTGGEDEISDAVLSVLDIAVDSRIKAGGDRRDAVVKTGDFEFSYAAAPDKVTVTRTKIRVGSIDAAFKGEGLNAETFHDFYSHNGKADLSVTFANSDLTSESTGGPSEAPYVMRFKALSSGVTAKIGDGRTKYGLTMNDGAYAMESEASEATGGANIGSLSMALDMPINRAPGVQPYALQLSIAGLAPDETFWKTTDPNGLIARTPISIEADLAGDALVLADLGEQSFEQAPVEVKTLEIRKLHLTGLGAAAEATGVLDLSGNAMMPDGELSLDLRGAVALIEGLVKAGIVPPEVMTVAGVTLQLAEPGDGSDHFTADIRVSNGAMTVNGRPLQ